MELRGRRARARQEVEEYHDRPLGDEALRFAQWFSRSQFQLMESFLGELGQAPGERDGAALRARFLEAVRRGQRALLLQGIVSVFLVLGAATTASAVVLDRLTTVNSRLPGMVQIPFEQFKDLLAGLGAAAASLTLVLLLVRFGIGRYVQLIEVSATFLAMEIAASRGA